jgi:hypothetical protein
LGYQVTRVERIETHGGSIRVYVGRTDLPGACQGFPLGMTRMDRDTVTEFLREEGEVGLLEHRSYLAFGKSIEKIKTNARNNMDALKLIYKKIAAYGSPAKATTSLNYFGINNNDIEYTIEDNDLKHDKLIPGANIPIKSKEYCNENLPDLIIVLAWNFFDVIVENNQELVDKGVKFINIKELQKPEMLI